MDPIGQNADGTLIYPDSGVDPMMVQPLGPTQPLAPQPVGEMGLYDPGAQQQGPIDQLNYNEMVAPETNAQIADMYMYDRGYIREGGRAAVPEGWVPQARSGGIPDFFEPERAALGERGMGLIRDEEAIRLHENQYDQDFIHKEALQAREWADEQRHKQAYFDEQVGRAKADFDGSLMEQRRLMAKGLSPYAGLSATGSNTGGKIASSLSMAAAIASGNDAAIQQTAASIDRAINAEIMSQKHAFELAGNATENAYSRLRDAYGDSSQAESHLRAMLLNAADAERADIVAQTGDANTELWSQKMQHALAERLLAANDQFAARAYGTLQERWQQGQSGSAGGMRRMTLDEQMAWQKSRAGNSQTQASTMNTYAETDLARAKAAGEQAKLGGDMRPDFTGLTEQSNKFSSATGGLVILNELAKMRGESGINMETGEYVGAKTGAGDDYAPGRGLADSAARLVPGMNKKSEDYDRLVKQAVGAFRRSVTGQSATEGELRRIIAEVDSPIESRHRAGMNSLLKALWADQKGAMSTMDPNQRDYLLRQRDQQMKSAPAPGAFGDTRRGR